MACFLFRGLFYETDEQGFLVLVNGDMHPYWDKKVGAFLARLERVQMTKDHWQVVIYLRKYYKEYSMEPMLRIYIRGIRNKLGRNKANTRYLYELYPGGLSQACKIAGLPKTHCCGY